MYGFAKSAAVTILLPPSGPLLVILAGLALCSWRPKVGRLIAMLGAITLWLASTPLVTSLLILEFGSNRPVNLDEAKRAQAIVVLGAGLRRQAAEFGGDTLGVLTLERVRYAATLARQTGLPILVTGGTPPHASHSEAELMSEALEGEFGTQVRWVESQSKNTHENAIRSAGLLHKDGVRRVVLVTHSFDAPRARRRFEQAGLGALSAPTQVPAITEWELKSLFPSANALSDCFYLGYESLAWLADRLVPGR